MKKSRLLAAACISFLLLLSASASAALLSRLGGLAVYDTDLDKTWLADANYAATELSDWRVSEIINAVVSVNGHELTENDFKDGFGNYSGKMTWWGARAWADQLSFGGHELWRLPITAVPDSNCVEGPGIGGNNPTLTAEGYSCTGSEMGHLFYDELGGTAGSSILTSGDPEELAKFTNLQSADYWSHTASPNQAFIAWRFRFFDGGQSKSGATSMFTELYAMAITKGDVFKSVVPIPPAIWLFGSGLLGLIGMARGNKTRPN